MRRKERIREKPFEKSVMTAKNGHGNTPDKMLGLRGGEAPEKKKSDVNSGQGDDCKGKKGKRTSQRRGLRKKATKHSHRGIIKEKGCIRKGCARQPLFLEKGAFWE